MSSLGLLFVLWVFFAGSFLFGLVAGKIVAFGAKGGGAGMGHICNRQANPSNFWVMMFLYGAISTYFFIATDGFGVATGLAERLGLGQALQDRP